MRIGGGTFLGGEVSWKVFRVLFYRVVLSVGIGDVLFDRIEQSIAIGWVLFYRVEMPMIIEDPLFL